MTKGTKSSSKTTSHNKDSPKIHNTHCSSSTIPLTATLCPQAPARHSHAFFIMSNTYTASLFTYKNPPPASSPSHTQTHNTFPFPSRKHQTTKTPIHPPTPTHITPHPPPTPPSLAHNVLPHNLHICLLPPPQKILDLLRRRRDPERKSQVRTRQVLSGPGQSKGREGGDTEEGL